MENEIKNDGKVEINKEGDESKNDRFRDTEEGKKNVR